ncbi:MULTISPECIES: TonB-dependent receptor [unclassified Sphingomonas]|jgi:outer membrane receptor protein involved in Fe transport|uniref:TonB-dependent receptor n=1 Tax=unclassified Sphingomonas TaxID=196159 RepID=UPI0006F991D0|nr:MULTISPECIES: TonB-dependent receptor [unclassified Sphingomonas]KQN31529.1 TonB-dependent receptor [Sphingomonas sp. Leaf34]
MRMIAYLLSAAATTALVTPVFAQQATSTVEAQSTPSQGTANASVDGQTNAATDADTTRAASAASAVAETGNSSDIVITATRRSERLSNVPIAVSAVGQAALQNSGGSDIRSLNQLAPSLLISSTGNESNASARIRGIGTVGDNPGLESSVAVFIDGVYRSRTGVGLNELGEIDRVEVLRGPQGTLFGRNASAGLINIITRSPEFDWHGNAEATYGNYDQKRIAAGITGPLIAEKLAFRVDGVFVKRDGFYKNVTAANGSESRINDRDRYFVRGQLLFNPTSQLSFRVIGDYSHRKESCCGAVYYSQVETTDPTANAAGVAPFFGTVNTDGAVTNNASNRIVDILRRQGAVFPLAGNKADPFSRQVAVTPGQTYRNTTKDYGGSVQADWDLGGATFTSITAYREYKSGNVSDIDYTNVDLTNRADDGNAYRQFHTFTQEARLQGSLFNDKLDWLVGGFYSKETLKLVDNAKFGSQYGQFAACRLVANVSPALAALGQNSAGCLNSTVILPTGATARQTVSGAFGGPNSAGGLITAALDRLTGGAGLGGGVNNVGDSGSIYRQKSENYAFFTHNILHLTDTLSLTGGLRYTHETKKFNAAFNNNNSVCPIQQAALAPLTQTQSGATAFAQGIVTLTCTGNSSTALNGLNLNDSFGDGEFTGTAVLSWKPFTKLLTYASYAKGYKAGGYNLDRSDLGGVNGVLSSRSNADAPGLRFNAEKVNNYEIGAKFNTRQFTLNVAAFRQEFTDFQLNTFNGSIFVVQNVQGCKDNLNGLDSDNGFNPVTGAQTGTCAPDRAKKAGVISQGVELEATMSPIKQVTFTAGYTYADTFARKNLVGSSTTGEALDRALFLLPGSQLSNAPKHVVTTSFAWTPDIGSNGLSGLLYVDSRLSSDYNTGSDLAPEKKQDGFAVVNARVGLRGKDQIWALEFWAQNVFNKNYIQVAFNTPFQGAGSSANVAAYGGTGNALYSAFLAEPRTYGLTLRSRF